jgi:hypothetical protein
MSTPLPNPHAYESRKWFQLGVRHLRIASSLLSTFPDGCVFHTYHAFEHCVSALIAAKGYPVPPEGRTPVVSGPRRMVYHSPSGTLPGEQSTHKVKLELFDQLANKAKRYYGTFSSLKRFLTPLRNHSLYYDPNNDLLPRQRFTRLDALQIYQRVRGWAKQLREDIP